MCRHYEFWKCNGHLSPQIYLSVTAIVLRSSNILHVSTSGSPNKRIRPHIHSLVRARTTVMHCSSRAEPGVICFCTTHACDACFTTLYMSTLHAGNKAAFMEVSGNLQMEVKDFVAVENRGNLVQYGRSPAAPYFCVRISVVIPVCLIKRMDVAGPVNGRHAWDGGERTCMRGMVPKVTQAIC